MLHDPGEPHKDIEQHSSSQPEQKTKGSSRQHERSGFEKEERERRKMEHKRSGKKKPAA